jgi:hypothetical protein
METLYQLTEQMSALESLLEDNGGELTPDIEALWQETGESLTRKVDNYNALIIKLKNYSSNLDSEIKRLQGLKKTADNSLKNVKEHIKSVMEQFGIDKLEGSYCKMTLTTSTATEVDEETVLAPYRSRLAKLDLPDWITADLKVSKTALKDAFKDKDVTPAGVQFVENQSLRIR